MPNERLNNPVNYGTVKIAIAIALSIFLLGNLWIYIEDGFQWFAIISGAVVSILVLIAIPGRSEVIYHPREVELTDTGIILYQKLGRKPVFIPWSGISWVAHANVNPRNRNWNTRDSHLGVSEKRFYVLYWEVEEAIIARYREILGYDLPNRIRN